MKQFIFLIFCIVCANPLASQIEMDSSSTYLYYKQYCFYDGSCTDSMLVTVASSPNGPVLGRNEIKVYQTEQIERLDLREASDSAVVAMFFKSLDVYNSCAGRRAGCDVFPFEASLFFEGGHFKPAYTVIMEGQELIAKNLGLLSVYDFKYKIEEIALSDGQMVIDFGQGTIIYCSQSFHKAYIFPHCLNFISKNHRLTPRNIELPKLDMEQN